MSTMKFIEVTMDETICSADHKAHDNHNTAQRADNEDCFFVIVSQWLTMHGLLYRKQLRLQQALEQNNVFGVILLYNFYN